MGDDALLARMVRSKAGWGPKDLERLYLSYGFDKREVPNTPCTAIVLIRSTSEQRWRGTRRCPSGIFRQPFA